MEAKIELAKAKRRPRKARECRPTLQAGAAHLGAWENAKKRKKKKQRCNLHVRKLVGQVPVSNSTFTFGTVLWVPNVKIDLDTGTWPTNFLACNLHLCFCFFSFFAFSHAP